MSMNLKPIHSFTGLFFDEDTVCYVYVSSNKSFAIEYLSTDKTQSTGMIEICRFSLSDRLEAI